MATRTDGRRRVILIGWDAADWNFITPLLDAGLMPGLQSVIERGVMGNLASMRPMLSPILWTSVATGHRGDRHGVLSFLEPTPDGTGVRPATSLSRRAKALWNILSQNGLKSHVVGWYATHPAEPINGVCVSDQFLHDDPSRPPATPWPLPEGAVHPPELRDDIALLRVRPHELAPADLRPFLPRLDEIAPDDPRVGRLRAALARTASVHAVATAILDAEPWDFVAVFYDAIDVVGHTFMPYHPPAMAHVSARDAGLFGGVMTGLYQFHDMMLRRLLQLAGDDATVILLSDHGFFHDHRRPADAGEGVDDERAARWHRPMGVVAMAGPGLRQDERLYGATLLDIAPTVLRLFDLPTGADMPGRVLRGAFVEPPERRTVPSWDDVEGPHPAGLHPPDLRVDPLAAAESIRQLQELGYLSAADDTAGLVRRVVDESNFNKAAILLHAGLAPAAAEVLAGLVEASPAAERLAVALASCHLEMHRPADAAAVLRSCEAAGGSLGGEATATLARALAESGDRDAATAAAEKVSDANDADALTRVGFVWRSLGRPERADAAFARACELDPESANAWYGRGAARWDLRDAASAERCARRAITLLHGFPAAHHLLALSLEQLGDAEAALASLDVAISVDATFQPAHRDAARLREARGDIAAALRHRRALEGHPF
jgi:predicted AlkP superfamily phosphohydrolase/phosphomutase/tetratricopeptide (TPR) repeat protein